MTQQNPLAWNVPIVDPHGRPTKEFMQKWATQRAINGSIPSLSTSDEVSDVLDLLSSSPGSLLIRGGSKWEPLTSPGDATKYLNGAGSYSTPPDTTYGVVTTSSDGLAPQLSGDPTEYLDGSGNYSTPAGGGGGGGGSSFMSASELLRPGTAAGQFIANVFVFLPVIFPAATTVTGVKSVITSLGSTTNVFAGIYKSSNLTAAGSALVAQGTSAAASLGINTMPFNTPQAVLPDVLYLIGFAGIGSGNWGLATISANKPGFFFSQSTTTLPSTLPSTSDLVTSQCSWWGY